MGRRCRGRALVAHLAHIRSERPVDESSTGIDLGEIKNNAARQIRDGWCGVEAWIDEMTEMRDTIEAIATGRIDEAFLDGKGSHFGVDEAFKRWGSAFAKESITPYIKSNIDLVSLVKLWRLSLTLVAYAAGAVGAEDSTVGTSTRLMLAELPLPEGFPHPPDSQLINLAETHDALLQGTARLHARLVDEVETAKRTAEQLRTQHGREVKSALTGLQREIEDGSLQLAPLTPKFELRKNIKVVDNKIAPQVPTPSTPAVVVSIQRRVVHAVETRKKEDPPARQTVPSRIDNLPRLSPSPKPGLNYTSSPMGTSTKRPAQLIRPVISVPSVASAVNAVKSGAPSNAPKSGALSNAPKSGAPSKPPREVRKPSNSPSKENRPRVPGAQESATGLRAVPAKGAFDKLTDQIAAFVETGDLGKPTTHVAPSVAKSRVKPPSAIPPVSSRPTTPVHATKANLRKAPASPHSPLAVATPSRKAVVSYEPFANPLNGLDQAPFKTRAEIPRTPIKSTPRMSTTPSKPLPSDQSRVATSSPLGKVHDKPRRQLDNLNRGTKLPNGVHAPTQPKAESSRPGSALQDLSQRLARLRGRAAATPESAPVVPQKRVANPPPASPAPVVPTRLFTLDLPTIDSQFPRSVSSTTLVGANTPSGDLPTHEELPPSFKIDRVFRLDLDDEALEALFDNRRYSRTTFDDIDLPTNYQSFPDDAAMALEEIL
ncbi:hypothetical protein M427DRAFT_193306 [Gonapodya prolifera JEL478]|uniref:HAUS augmin-like complex subunit 6 N-terminal domain-containing protein n=1 Tax=Gonapodya prolifera (strain JEL478) TaxID=1344416 RepID=A0A139A043_GONPJ|nr:hypothetical protein M427DRAFT_193306 [Gonapodya prolifera JEL478]|eukprot:KXS10008.1 hypothetical protein M427DRAFT_193306 [Gonapodya prolifera JEL478]